MNPCPSHHCLSLNRPILFVAVFVFLLSALPLLSQAREKYTLSWKRNEAGIQNVLWVLNGVAQGKGMDGLVVLYESLVNEGGAIRVVIPDNEDITNPSYTPPYYWDAVILAIFEKKSSVRYFWKKRETPIFQLTWTWRRDYPSGEFTDILEFRLDGKSLGNGEEALQKLVGLKKSRYAFIQFIENRPVSLSGFYVGMLPLPGGWDSKLKWMGFRREDYLFPKTIHSPSEEAR